MSLFTAVILVFALLEVNLGTIDNAAHLENIISTMNFGRYKYIPAREFLEEMQDAISSKNHLPIIALWTRFEYCRLEDDDECDENAELYSKFVNLTKLVERIPIQYFPATQDECVLKCSKPCDNAIKIGCNKVCGNLCETKLSYYTKRIYHMEMNQFTDDLRRMNVPTYHGSPVKV